jgi:AAA family ATP:ADP antiporter
VLFTVVSRSEKYAAKLVIDLVVQRAGDAVAAGAFQVLDVTLHLGAGGVAAAGAAACAAWLLAGARLGRMHARMAGGGARPRRGGGGGAPAAAAALPAQPPPPRRRRQEV